MPYDDEIFDGIKPPTSRRPASVSAFCDSSLARKDGEPAFPLARHLPAPATQSFGHFGGHKITRAQIKDDKRLAKGVHLSSPSET